MLLCVCQHFPSEELGNAVVVGADGESTKWTPEPWVFNLSFVCGLVWATEALMEK